MAHFRGTVKGARGMASRLGTGKSGIIATINGWNVGIMVIGRKTKNGDSFTVFSTGGSTGSKQDLLICEIKEND